MSDPLGHSDMYKRVPSCPTFGLGSLGYPDYLATIVLAVAY